MAASEITAYKCAFIMIVESDSQRHSYNHLALAFVFVC